MGSVRERLLALATTRTKEVEIEGEKFFVKEISAAQFGEYGTLVKKDRTKAVASLLQVSIVDEGGELALNEEDAKAIAGSARVTTPLLSVIMDINGFGDNEKETDAS